MTTVTECRTASDITSALETLLAAYRFDYYGVTRQQRPLDDQMQLVLAGRWPERWLETYVAKKYIVSDPTVRYLGVAQRGFRWREALSAFRSDPHRTRMERMMSDAARFGLEDGYIFPIHSRNGLLGNMSIGGKGADLSPMEMALFDAVAKRVFWRYLEVTKKAAELENVRNVEAKLTRREMEVLSYLADGMTSNEISKVLAISNHTVDWYMNGIQDKLNAKNRQHVVALAFRRGLIT
nr:MULTISPECIES: LuxR family transcriptional regulator [unclassified Ciceribacter]